MQFYQQIVGQYNKASPVQKSYLSIALTLGLLIILILLIFPAVNHVLKINKEISDARIVEQKLEDKIASLEKAETNYNQAKDRLKIIDEALPTGSAVEQYVKQIEGLVTKNNLTLAGVQFSDIPLSPPTNKDRLGLREVDYVATVEGKFINFKTFLTDFEGLIRTTDITSISVSENQLIISAAFKATVYYLGDQTQRAQKTNPTGGNTESNPTKSGQNQ